MDAHQQAGLTGGLGTASADFGHTGEFPGLLALDAQGNILPDAANWVSVTSDSGLEYGILSGLPSVPEPSSVIILGTGVFLFAVCYSRRSKNRRPTGRQLLDPMRSTIA